MYNANGRLFREFGDNGRLLTEFYSSRGVEGNALAIDSRDRIILAGRAVIGEEFRFAVARYKSDGRRDTGFDRDGKVLTNFGSTAHEGGKSVAIDRRDRVVVGGYAVRLATGPEGNQTMYALARYLEDGSLDRSFDRDGKVLTAFSPARGSAEGLAIDSRNRIVAGGTLRTGSNRVAVARYRDNGSLDRSFGDDGQVLTEFRSASYLSVDDLAVDSRDRVVVAGHARIDGRPQFALARYSPNGELDRRFDRDGKVLVNFRSSVSEGARAIAIDRDDRVVAAGWAKVDGETQFSLVRLHAENGELDTTFERDGKALANFLSTDSESISAIAISRDRKILVAGTSDLLNDSQFAIARFTAAGRLDRTFDSDGKVLTNFRSLGMRQSKANGIAELSDGRIVVAGTANS